MYFAVCTTNREGMEQTRLSLSDEFRSYLHGQPGVTVHHAGPLMSEDGGAVTGSLIVLEAASLAAAREFVANSPFGKADLFAESHIQAWDWLTGTPA